MKDFDRYGRTRIQIRGTPMTIDERIEKLTERHEAVAQSVEMLTIENRETRKMVEGLVLGIRDLLAVVVSHETRISRIEGI